MNITKENIVGEVVAQDYRTASVFKSFNIDFCCKGNRSIVEVCEKEQVDADNLISELNQAHLKSGTDLINVKSWDMDLLVDYIEKKHHRYVNRKIPEIKAYLNKVAKVHGDRHPELHEIEKLFTGSALNLSEHMKKEEVILFPYIRKIAADPRPQNAPFGTVDNPIQSMMQEHDNEGERFRKIASLSDNYTPPADACTTYKVVFALLREFEEDLHLHIHLENNILFPAAIRAEKKLFESHN